MVSVKSKGIEDETERRIAGFQSNQGPSIQVTEISTMCFTNLGKLNLPMVVRF
jgi:hypothetical protein